MTRDSVVVCTVCGCARRVSFARCLATGWPKHCGYTMRLERTEACIGESTARAIRATRRLDAEQDA